ncbi:MAG: hypothetical protein FRX48_04619 [Lasallia pustulata]|uniref:Uncharacterized protein n=1 Tax=Lasallia pustulata TaxID=136370 RepID=A0A5M8PQU5_9LECA|nr:MAG: hypothetical protein FRX48_04619 [Lasallia pustulata]
MVVPQGLADGWWHFGTTIIGAYIARWQDVSRGASTKPMYQRAAHPAMVCPSWSNFDQNFQQYLRRSRRSRGISTILKRQRQSCSGSQASQEVRGVLGLELYRSFHIAMPAQC